MEHVVGEPLGEIGTVQIGAADGADHQRPAREESDVDAVALEHIDVMVAGVALVSRSPAMTRPARARRDPRRTTPKCGVASLAAAGATNVTPSWAAARAGLPVT